MQRERGLVHYLCQLDRHLLAFLQKRYDQIGNAVVCFTSVSAMLEVTS